jgi:uroporphyrinogen-III decarboxylase
LISGFVEMGLFERSYLLLGMDQALIAYVTRPRLMYELLGALADYKIELIERFDDAAGLDLVWYGDDWGTQDRLFMHPDVWREVIKPHTRRIYACMKRRGILIDQHSCGRIEAIFPDVIAMGADIWNPCQPCNHLAGLKARYGGQIAFCGGIDSQFVLSRPGATAEEVRAEVRRRIDEMAAGGGYIAAPSHSVPYDPALLQAMNNEIATYGRRYYEEWGATHG